MSGTSTPLSDTEKKYLSEKEIKENYRLACKAFPKSDLKIYVPPESLSTSQRLQLEGIKNISDSSDCIIQRTDLFLSQPTLSDPRSDITGSKKVFPKTVTYVPVVITIFWNRFPIPSEDSIGNFVPFREKMSWLLFSPRNHEFWVLRLISAQQK